MSGTALITGGSSGLGLACAEILGLRNYEIIILARNKERIDNALRILHAKGIKAQGISCDVTDNPQLSEAVLKVKSLYQNLNFLILNAGEVSTQLLCDYTSPEELKRDIEIDLWGTILSAWHFVPLLSEGSKILMTSSGYGLMGAAGYSTYCAAKAGIVNFGASLRRELLCKKINVYVVCPGDMDTPQFEGEIAGQPQWMKEQNSPRKVVPVRFAAEKILKKCKGNSQMLILPDPIVKLLYYCMKILPARWITFLLDRMIPRPRS
jgi:short-subunit dehydrogenase